MQLAVHDETQIYEDSIRLEESNRELAAVNRRLQQMYERMADDVKEKESLNLKIQLLDIAWRTVQGEHIFPDHPPAVELEDIFSSEIPPAQL